MDRQSTKIQNFLLNTAVLNRLSASLFDAVSNQEESQETLVALDHANLFIIPLDNERNWYRYHHLFQELLRQRLDVKPPTPVTTVPNSTRYKGLD